MKLRGISELMVKEALTHPSNLGVSREDRSLVFKKFKKGIVKIVFVRKKDIYVIISVIWDIIYKK